MAVWRLGKSVRNPRSARSPDQGIGRLRFGLTHGSGHMLSGRYSADMGASLAFVGLF